MVAARPPTEKDEDFQEKKQAKKMARKRKARRLKKGIFNLIELPSQPVGCQLSQTEDVHVCTVYSIGDESF